MADNNYTTDSNMSFELIDGGTNKKNTFFLTNFYAGTNSINILRLTATDPVELYYSDKGNCNEFNYSFALIFPKAVLDATRLDGIRFLDQLAQWASYIKETETECHIYLLSRTKQLIDANGSEFLLQNLPIAHKSSSVTDIALLYRKFGNTADQYCIKTWLDIVNHSGINASPLRLVNDTPVIPLNGQRSMQLRLFNISGKNLDLQKLRLQLHFDIFEGLMQSPEALMPKSTFDNVSLINFSYKKKTSNSHSSVPLASFIKNTASGQSIYRAVFDFNQNAALIDDLKSFSPEDQLVISFPDFQAHNMPGTSPLTLYYFNTANYWDGMLTTSSKRSAYDENGINQPEITGTVNIKGKVRESGYDLLPTGVIIIWKGDKVPDGWVLCDGNNNTPNLQSRFVMGYGPGYNKDTYGGNANAEVISHTHTFTTDEGGLHNHNVILTKNNGASDEQGWPANNNHFALRSTDRNATHNPNYATGVYNNNLTQNNGNHTHGGTTKATGVEGKDKNLPPYFVLAYIMKQ